MSHDPHEVSSLVLKYGVGVEGLRDRAAICDTCVHTKHIGLCGELVEIIDGDVSWDEPCRCEGH